MHAYAAMLLHVSCPNVFYNTLLRARRMPWAHVYLCEGDRNALVEAAASQQSFHFFVHGSCNPHSNAFFQHVGIRCEDGTVNNSFFLDQLLLFKFMHSLVLSILCMHGQGICGSRRDDDDRACPACFHSVSFHLMEVQAGFIVPLALWLQGRVAHHFRSKIDFVRYN